MYTFAIISYFDKQTTREIRDIQKKLSEITGSRSSLDTWLPHITVGSAIKVKENQLKELYENIEGFLENVPVFTIQTREFSFMDDWAGGSRPGSTPYVVYIKLSGYDVLTKIATFFEEQIKPMYPVHYQQPWPYNPHITIAYKDLTDKGYERIKEYLSSKVFEKTIIIDNVCLATKNKNGIYEEFKRFKLKGG